jgi:hypothetical protein
MIRISISGGGAHIIKGRKERSSKGYRSCSLWKVPSDNEIQMQLIKVLSFQGEIRLKRQPFSVYWNICIFALWLLQPIEV